jgi:hypothetical protein
MYVPERTRADLRMSLALYGGMFLGELVRALVHARKTKPVPTPEVPDVSVVPE